MPQYALGFMGMTRRIYTYPDNLGWTTWNFVSTIGAFMMGIGFIFQVVQILYSIKYGERDVTGDPWDGRTLEWSIPSPAPLYNFAVIPQVRGKDEWWRIKQEMQKPDYKKTEVHIEPIHMPKNSGLPFILSVFFFIAGFGFTFNWIWMGVAGLVGVAICLFARSFDYDTDYYIPAEEVKRTEAALGRL
jgi:cytochrome aa3-600 menaquinol oxidase subunit I